MVMEAQCWTTIQSNKGTDIGQRRGEQRRGHRGRGDEWGRRWFCFFCHTNHCAGTALIPRAHTEMKPTRAPTTSPVVLKIASVCLGFNSICTLTAVRVSRRRPPILVPATIAQVSMYWFPCMSSRSLIFVVRTGGCVSLSKTSSLGTIEVYSTVHKNY